MLIVRSPLRITLGGGGTDLPSYYTNFGGFTISAAIDKYVYVTVTRPFSPGIYLKYSEIEKVSSPELVRHPILRECLKFVPYEQIEITSLADIPSGTGLGSSGSFTVALLKALNVFGGGYLSAEELAREASRIEIEVLNYPVGKQDQYIAAYGGLKCLTFNAEGGVGVENLKVSSDTLHALEDNLLLFFTGFTHETPAVLRDQDTKSKSNDAKMLENLHYTKSIGLESKALLEKGNLELFATLMQEHWYYKQKRSPDMTNSRINHLYTKGIANGAWGGKLVGAGGGGFLLFYTENPKQLRRAMTEESIEEVRFRFNFEGTKVLLS